MYWFHFQTRVNKHVTEGGNVKLTILEAMVQGYQGCSFVVSVSEKFLIKKKRGDRGPALRVTQDGLVELA